MDGGNKQDAIAIESMLESALLNIHEKIPEMKSVIVQSENAKCYNVNELRMLTALLNTQSTIKVEQLIFTEAQDEKA